MSRLECDRCKSVFVDVIRVRRCPLCGNTSFTNAEETKGTMLMPKFPKWFTRDGNFGFAYVGNIRLDKEADLN